MIFFILALAAVCMFKFSFARKKALPEGEEFFKDYMSIEKTTSIKGIFITIVFLSHIIPFLTLSDSILDSSYSRIITTIGQSMVAPFMFYSGYGIMYSINKKGLDYIKGIPLKRASKVLLHFAIAVLLFAILQTAIGNYFTPYQYALSLIGWESLGNSNWYIFIVLCLYLITWLAFSISKAEKKLGLILTIVFSLVLIILMYIFKEMWWYDTILCYSLGMLFFLVQPRIEKILFINNWVYYLVLLILAGGCFVTIFILRGTVFTIIRHMLFALLVVVFTMKFSIHNKILLFLGKHLFEIYIIQRLPMIFLSHIGVENKYIFFIIAFIATIALATVFSYMLKKLDSVLYKNK